MRNPYTFAGDPLTGKIHINDVGQSSWEEINLAVKGANYGWPTCEGLSCGNNPNFTNPIYTYSHAVGQAITGGVFYRAGRRHLGSVSRVAAVECGPAPSRVGRAKQRLYLLLNGGGGLPKLVGSIGTQTVPALEPAFDLLL
ncbi:MAG: hypothetical protein AUI36_12500 [Cyanobacteria bacterium 13_1_40CM_2_61_4]|nr:MAG: hypothetical protein AUI36_12500 [Cyanobacteria bacterium 13_1_40CM_2_61_4]